VAALAVAVPAFAHTGQASISGFLHPLSGADHITAATSLALWAALLGGRALWLVPASARIRLPLAATMGAAGFFAVFEGHAHGMVADGGAFGFGAGLVAATVLLLRAGAGLGRKLRGRRRSRVARIRPREGARVAARYSRRLGHTLRARAVA
jgi:urease accessory protein